MSNERLARARGNPLLRVLKGLGVMLMVVLMGFARALGAGVRIEAPEQRNKVTQVNKKR